MFWGLDILEHKGHSSDLKLQVTSSDLKVSLNPLK